MPAKNHDLHGNAPDKSAVALLLIDVINDLRFDTGRAMLEFALPMAENIRELRARADEAGVPVIYVNDNFGRWRSDLAHLVEHCLEDGVVGKPLVEILKPRPNDYFVLKPKHSGFYSSTLQLLLDYLGVRTVVLTGLQTHICILFTANDAYMRDYHIVVPHDCTCSDSERKHTIALEEIAETLKATVLASTEIDFGVLSAPNEAG
jgi:nicotinamidase-related amidase